MSGYSPVTRHRQSTSPSNVLHFGKQTDAGALTLIRSQMSLNLGWPFPDTSCSKSLPCSHCDPSLSKTLKKKMVKTNQEGSMHMNTVLKQRTVCQGTKLVFSFKTRVPSQTTQSRGGDRLQMSHPQAHRGCPQCWQHGPETGRESRQPIL